MVAYKLMYQKGKFLFLQHSSKSSGLVPKVFCIEDPGGQN